jgi:hypothetical protein
VFLARYFPTKRLASRNTASFLATPLEPCAAYIFISFLEKAYYAVELRPRRFFEVSKRGGMAICRDVHKKGFFAYLFYNQS